MWEAIKYVGSSFTLIAFISAVASITYRYYILRTERLIKTAPEAERASLVQDALEFFRVDTANLSQSQQYDIALEQIRSKGRRFQLSALVIIILAIVAASITGFAIFENSRGVAIDQSLPSLRFAGVDTGRPVGPAVAEPSGSSVQLFENGWMVAQFEQDMLFAIAFDANGSLKWFKTSEDGFVKGLPIAGDGNAYDRLLILGFRWYYFRSTSEALRKALGKPITRETRAWLQFQDWSNGELIYGMPSTVPDYQMGQFQVLAGAFLTGAQSQQSGAGEYQKITAGSLKGDPEYCSVNWYPANEDRSLPTELKSLITEGKCNSARGMDVFTSPHSAVILK
jgi:hypothetical protein